MAKLLLCEMKKLNFEEVCEDAKLVWEKSVGDMNPNHSYIKLFEKLSKAE